MDILLKVFQDLGADQSLFVQFAIVIVMYFLTKMVFVKHLQTVLDTRENKTSKLEGSVEKQFAEIKKTQDEYKEKIQAANKRIKTELDTQKNEITKAEEAKYRTKEKEINQYIENSKQEVQESIKEKKAEVLGNAEQLSSSLVQKITKEA